MNGHARRIAFFLVVAAVALTLAPPAAAAPRAVPTFNEQVAPLVHQHCTPCHRPGGPGPFNLISYQELRKRGKQVVEVTQSGFMPPWLPSAGHGVFEGQRRLDPAELELLRRWVDGGMAAGDPAAAPNPPQFGSGWQLGEPDLVVELASPYLLDADALGRVSTA